MAIKNPEFCADTQNEKNKNEKAWPKSIVFKKVLHFL